MDPTRLPRCRLRAILAGAALLAALASGFATFAQTPPAQPEAFRPEIATPLQAAEAMIREKKYGEALSLIRQAEAVSNRTPAENILIERVRAVAAFGAGDFPTATRSFETVITSGRLTPADQSKMIQVVAQLYFQSKDYPKAAMWAARSLKESGPNADVQWLMISAQYLADDCPSASRELRSLVETAAPPNREWLSMLASCYTKLGDDAGNVYALDKFLAYYPTKEHWADAIRRVESKPGFPDRLRLDVLRLRHATGTFSGAPAYAAMTQLSLAAALPAEAKKISDEGFASGALGTGPDAEQQKRLRDTAAKQVDDDQKQLPQSAKAAGAAKDGIALVNVGFAYVSAGQFDTGLALMEAGIAKGGLRQPEDAKLHLGIGYLAAGQKTKAIQAFKEVGGTDGTADLARLWLIHAQRPTG